MKLTKRLLALALTVPLFLVTACDGKNATGLTQSPESSPPKSNTSSSTPSSSATSNEYKPATLEHPAQNVPVPKYPEAGKKNDKKGREAVVRQYLDAADYVKETGEGKPLEEVTFEECTECFGLQREMEKLYSSGGWLVGGKINSIQLAEQPLKDELDRYLIDVIAEEDDALIVDGNQTPSETKKHPGNHIKGTIWVQYSKKQGRLIVVQFRVYDKRQAS